MYASSRRAWWESSDEAPLFAHHTRSSSSLPRTRLPWRTTRRHAASATAQFLSASRRPRTSSVVRGRRFLLRTVLGDSRSTVVPVSRNARRVRQTSAHSRLPMLRLAVHRAPQRSKTRAVAEKSARLLPKSPPFFAQTRPLFMRTSRDSPKRR